MRVSGHEAGAGKGGLSTMANSTLEVLSILVFKEKAEPVEWRTNRSKS